MTMMVPGLLAAYALVVAAAGTWWLPRASWPRRLPRLGIAACQVLTVTFVASMLLAGLLIAIPCLPDGVNLDVAAELADHYSSARGIAIGSAAAAASLTAIGRLLWAAASAMACRAPSGARSVRRQRSPQKGKSACFSESVGVWQMGQRCRMGST